MDHPYPSLKFVPVKDLDRSIMSFEGFTAEDPAAEKLGKVDGFIIDIDSALPYYTVIDAGGWFRSKHILIPIGHFALDTESKRLIADVPKERVKRFPGFELDFFPKLMRQDLDRMADEIARECCPDLVGPAETVSLAVSTHYRTPAWWDTSFYSGRQAENEQAANRPR